MVSGEVDEGWARQHHNVWLDEVQRGRGHAVHDDAGGRSAAAPT
jgi:cytochrome b subunit of formate dehydrogenase